MFGGALAAAAPAANAYPGDPMPGCEAQVFATYCDGPIRPDNTFKRCWSVPPSSFNGASGPVYVPGTTTCQMVDLAQPWPMFPLGAPQHHMMSRAEMA